MSQDGDDIQVPPPKKARVEGNASEASVREVSECPDASRYNSWTEKEVLGFFRSRKIDMEGLKFDLKTLLQRMIEDDENKDAQIEGKHLDRLALFTDGEPHIVMAIAEEIQIEKVRRAIMTIIRYAKSLQQQRHATFNDPIHGFVVLHPLLVEIIDTPEFQRLRHIKQLGPTCYVYPGATHTRFAHSIGVCYIAGELGRSLQRRQPELEITDNDILCIQIAGLSHDLGRGSFSCMFEELAEEILLEHRPTSEEPLVDKWKWELISCKVFDNICQKKKERFQHYGLKSNDIDFIREQLDGRESKKGRPGKKFLYEIVANKRNGIDVVKWDYFARDCHYLGISSDFNWRRCMSVACIAAPDDDPEDRQICLRDKEAPNIYNMIHTRTILNQQAYKHKTTRAVELMLKDCLRLTRKLRLIQGPCDERSKQQSWCLEEAVLAAGKRQDADISGFLLLTDDITSHILNARYSDYLENECDNLKKAQELLRNIESRQLYRLVGSASIPAKKVGSRQWKSSQLAQEIFKSDDNVYVDVVTFSFASEDSAVVPNPDDGNPIRDLLFCTKKEPWKAISVDQDEIMQLSIPRQFSETVVRVYCKDGDQHRTYLQKFTREAECVFGPDVKISTPYTSEERPQRPKEQAPPDKPK